MLGARYVAYIHEELLAIFWPASENMASGGIRDHALLESAVARPFQSAFEQDIYPTVIQKGVALFHSLIANHAFVDGNKRTAVTALDHFLLANGFVLGISNSSMYELATTTASYRERQSSHEEALAEVADSIADFITPIAQLKGQGATYTGHGGMLRAVAGFPALQGSFEATRNLRRWIRKHPFNRLIPSE